MGYPSLRRLLDLVNDAGGAFTTVEEMLPAIAAVTAGVDRWLDVCSALITAHRKSTLRARGFAVGDPINEQTCPRHLREDSTT